MRKFFLSGFTVEKWRQVSRETESVLVAQMYADMVIKIAFNLTHGEVYWLKREAWAIDVDRDFIRRRYFRVVGTILVKKAPYEVEVFVKLACRENSSPRWFLIDYTDVDLDYKPKGLPPSKLNSCWEPSEKLTTLQGL